MMIETTIEMYAFRLFFFFMQFKQPGMVFLMLLLSFLFAVNTFSIL